MRVVLLLILMQECCNPVLGNSCQWGNVLGCVPIRIKHLLHSSAARYMEIFYLPCHLRGGGGGGGGGGDRNSM